MCGVDSTNSGRREDSVQSSGKDLLRECVFDIQAHQAVWAEGEEEQNGKTGEQPRSEGTGDQNDWMLWESTICKRRQKCTP